MGEKTYQQIRDYIISNINKNFNKKRHKITKNKPKTIYKIKPIGDGPDRFYNIYNELLTDYNRKYCEHFEFYLKKQSVPHCYFLMVNNKSRTA
jgi:hypothetical protein